MISMVAAMMVTSDLFGVGFALDLHFKDALALAGILSMSSLGLVAKVLADTGYLKEPLGLEIFATVIIAEMITLLVVGFSIGERTIAAHDHLRGAFSVVFLLAEVAAFAVVAWILSARVMPPKILFLKRIFNVPELSFGLLIGGLFLSYPAASLSIRSFADNWIVPDQQDYVVVNEGAVAGIVSPARLTSVPMVAWGQTPLQEVLQPEPPHAEPDEHIVDVLQQTSRHSLSVIPVLDTDSEEFQGTITSHDVVDLVLLMDEIADELKELEKERVN